VLLAGTRVHGDGQAVRPHGRVQRGVLVHVLHQQGGADGGPVVDARAAVPVSARPANTTGLSMIFGKLVDPPDSRLFSPLMRSCADRSLLQVTNAEGCFSLKILLVFGGAGRDLAACRQSDPLFNL